MTRHLLSLGLVAALALPSWAHDLKIFASRQYIPEGEGKAVIYLSWGHRVPVDELVVAAPLERYDLISPGGSVTALKKEGTSLQENAVELKEAGLHTVVSTRKSGIFTYILDSENNRQLKRGSKADNAGAKIDSSTRYAQAGKAMIVVGKPGDAAPKPIGLPIEVVPLDPPSKWTANSTIRFQILVDGKPVPSADINARSIGFKPENAWSYSTQSNAQGEFTVRPSELGTWVIRANVKKLAQGADREQFDLDSNTATLTLEVLP
jgi:uncharacterized GH25 family protein